MAKKTIDNVDVTGKRVLMRVDFNVPQDDSGAITDDRRIRMALPSIESVVKRGGRLVLISHLGRPEGTGFEAEYSLKPAADRLRELLSGVNVVFPSQDCTDRAAAAAVAGLQNGQIAVLENLRFQKGEKKGDAAFASALAAYGDIYCNDAFGTAHRNDASMFAVPQAMAGKPRVAGLLLQRELQYLSEAIAAARKPFTAILGGAKVSDKLGAIDNLMGRVDTILIGGAMAYTFLKAQGSSIGSSRVQEDMLEQAAGILKAAEGRGTTIRLPEDHVIAQELKAGVATKVCVGDIPAEWMGLDIGPQTAQSFAAVVSRSRTLVWNGPVGVFETAPFDAGSRAVAKAAVEATKQGAITIVGGGDTAAAVEEFGLAEGFSHVSTGGGASLEMLEGKAFDSVGVLDDA